MEKKPEPSLWVAPEGTEPGPHLQAVGPRIDDKHRITPRLALVVAIARQQVGIRPVLPTCPAGPEPSFRRRLHARGHRKGQVLLRVGRKGIEDELRGDVDAVEQVLRHDGPRRVIVVCSAGSQRQGEQCQDVEDLAFHE